MLYARALAVPLADERDDRHAHVERFQRAVDAAVGHRVEHEVDDAVARLVLRRRRVPAAGRSRAPRAMPRRGDKPRDSAHASRDDSGETASTARGRARARRATAQGSGATA